MAGLRKNYNLEKTTINKLEEIAGLYGMNQTAVISMLVTDKYLEIAKDRKEIEEGIPSNTED